MQLQRKHAEEVRNIRLSQDDGVDKLKESLRWKDNEIISLRSEMENRIQNLQRDLDLTRPRLEEAETKLSVKESEIVELKNFCTKRDLLWIKLRNDKRTIMAKMHKLVH